MKEFDSSKSEYEAYQKVMKKYENSAAGKQRESLKEKLGKHDREVKEQEKKRQYRVIRPKDRGGR